MHRDAGPEPTQAIVADFDFPQPPEKVWRALTEPALLAAWLMPNDIRPVVGHRFTFQTKPVPGWDGVVQCEVLAVTPPRLLSYAWRGGNREVEGYGHSLDTIVTWTLTPTANGGTHVHLVHDGFRPEDAYAYNGMGNGWRSGVPVGLARVLAGMD